MLAPCTPTERLETLKGKIKEIRNLAADQSEQEVGILILRCDLLLL